MAEKSFSVQKDIRIIVLPASSKVQLSDNDTFLDTRIPIDSERILQIVDRDGIIKVETTLPITQIGGTKFSFDDEQVYYDNKLCMFQPSQSAIAVILLKTYYDDPQKMLTATELLQILKDAGHAVAEKTLRRDLSDIRHMFNTVTNTKEHNFIPNQRHLGYHFDPLF